MTEFQVVDLDDKFKDIFQEKLKVKRHAGYRYMRLVIHFIRIPFKSKGERQRKGENNKKERRLNLHALARDISLPTEKCPLRNKIIYE